MRAARIKEQLNSSHIGLERNHIKHSMTQPLLSTYSKLSLTLHIHLFFKFMCSMLRMSATLLNEYGMVWYLLQVYTVGHKNGATFIFTITLANVDRFQ